MQYFFIWLTSAIIFGIITYAIADSKGRKNGFWAGFLLGIIGLIMVLCLKDLPPEQREGSHIIALKENKYDNLEKLQKLRESGALTEEEFQKEKQKLLE